MPSASAPRPRYRKSSQPARQLRSVRSGKRQQTSAFTSRIRCIRSGRAYSMDFTVREVVRTAAFNHVAGERPRAAGKTNERHALATLRIRQRLADFAHRVRHVAQRGADIRHGKARDVSLSAHRMRQSSDLRRATNSSPRPMAAVSTVRMSGEQDGCVERIASRVAAASLQSRRPGSSRDQENCSSRERASRCIPAGTGPPDA